MAEKTDSDAQRLGRAIQVRRAELGLKRPDLARRAELSYPYVSEIENGMKMPSTKALGLLAQALELSMTELMGRAESLEDLGDATQPTLDPALGEVHSQRRLFSKVDAVTDYPAASDMRYQPLLPSASGEGRPDQRLEELIRTIVRAEVAAWARTELPALVRSEVQRALRETDQER